MHMYTKKQKLMQRNKNIESELRIANALQNSRHHRRRRRHRRRRQQQKQQKQTA